MSKRSYLFFRLWTALVFCASIFWWFWRWVPRVRVFPKAKRSFGARLIRETETICTIDPALHECNVTLEGSCPADQTRTVVTGVKFTIGKAIITWPRDDRA